MSKVYPLTGIRVLDLTRILAGPLCTQYLGDLGAEIIKIENPKGGDDTRAWGPPFLGTESAYYLGINRNKKSICLDIKTKKGFKILKDLIKKSDVVIDNFKPGFWDKIGLPDNWFSKNVKNVVRTSISGYGIKGPQGGLPGYDFLMQAESGLMKITGETNGEPMKLGVAIVDIVTGLNAVISVLSGLLLNDKIKNKNILTEVNLYNSGIFLLANVASNTLISNKDAERYGNGHPNIVPYNLFKSKSGELAVSVGNDNQFKVFSKLLKKPEWSIDKRFAKNSDRIKNRVLIERLINEELSKKNRSYWYNLFLKNNIPSAIVRGVKEALKHPQTQDNDMTVKLNKKNMKTLETLNSPIQINNQRGLTNPVYPPNLGEDTEKILNKVLGLKVSEINKLKSLNVIK